VAGEIARAFVRIVPNSSGFQSTLMRQTSGVGRSVGSTIGKGLAVGLGASVAAAGAGLLSAAKLAIDFDKSMRNVNSIAKLNERQFQNLNKRVLDLGKTAGVAPKTLADGLYDVVSSGFKADDAMKILTAGARAAKAGLTDTATATGAVTAVLNAYHEGASKAGEVSDALFQTVNVGVINFEQLAQNIGDVLPFASSLGVNIQNVGGAIATMTKEGISGAETVTRIKAVMTQFLSPSKDLAARFKDLGFESGEAMIKSKGFQGSLDLLAKSTHGSKSEMAKLFPDVRALGGALALTGANSKTANSDLQALAQSQGATASAAKEQAKSISQQWDKAIGRLQASAITLGSQILPTISSGIGLFSKLTDKVGELAAKPSIKLKAEFVLDQITQAAGSIKDSISSAIDEALNGAAMPTAGGRFAHAGFDSKSLTDQLQSAFNGVDWGAIGKQVTDGIKTAVTTGEDFLGPLIDQMNTAVAAHAGDFANTGALILANMVTTLTDPSFWAAHWQLAIAVAIAVFPAGKIARVGELILKEFAPLGLRLGEVFGKAGSEAVLRLGVGMEKVAGKVGVFLFDALVASAGFAAKAAVFIAKGYYSVLTKELGLGSKLVRGVVSLATKVGIIGAISAAVGAAKQLGSAIINGLSSALSTIFSAVTNAFNGVKDAIANAASAAVGWAAGVGEAIVNGIVNGITGIAGRIADSLGSALTSAKNHALSVIGANSPSKVFAKEVGEPISEGIALGITNKSSRVKHALKATLNSATQAALADAKSNLNSIAGSVADSVGQIIDAQVQRAVAPLQAKLAASQKAGAAQQTAQQRADLVAQLRGGKNEGESDADFIKRQADVRAQLADMDRQAREDALQGQIDAIQTEADKRKAATTQTINDLAAEFNAGKITGKQFTTALTQVLKDNKVDVAQAGDLLGFAFAQSFSAQLTGITKQIGAISAVIGAPGGSAGGAGFNVDVTNPLDVVRSQLKDARASLKQDQKDLRDAHKTKTKSDDRREAAAIARDRKTIAALDAILKFATRQQASGSINVNMAAGAPSIEELLAAILSGAAR